MTFTIFPTRKTIRPSSWFSLKPRNFIKSKISDNPLLNNPVGIPPSNLPFGGMPGMENGGGKPKGEGNSLFSNLGINSLGADPSGGAKFPTPSPSMGMSFPPFMGFPFMMPWAMQQQQQQLMAIQPPAANPLPTKDKRESKEKEVSTKKRKRSYSSDSDSSRSSRDRSYNRKRKSRKRSRSRDRRHHHRSRRH